MGRAIVSDEVELEIRRMLGELQQRALARTVDWGRAKPGVQALIEGHEVSIGSGAALQLGTPPGTKKRDLAEVYRAWFEAWYRSLGFTVTVPKPNVPNREFARRAKKHQELRYEPAASEVPYEAFMRAVGQGDHWTVTDEGERAKIVWEPAATGYWYWADAQDDCPRLGTTWNDLTAAIKLLSLEECVKHWYATKAGASLGAFAKGKTGRMLDVQTWTWLRTRFGPGALDAGGVDGRVVVYRNSAESLSFATDDEGGRAADVVK